MSDVKEKENSDVNNTLDVSNEIIYRHLKFSLVAGAIPIPLVDIAAITAIQIDMLKQLSDAYKVDFNRERGKSIASSLFSATVGSLIGRAGASAVKVVPGIGTLLGIGSQVILAGASTYALGKVFQYHFENNGNLYDFDVQKMKEKFKEFFQKGKDKAEEMNTQSREEVLETIEKLHALKEKGVITEEEFNKSKEELLSKIA